MAYIKYTDEQKCLANHIDLVEFLQRRGEKLRSEGHEYRWVSGHDSVMIRGNEWHRHSEDQGGYPVNFCMKFFNLEYPKAMNLLLGSDAPVVTYKPSPSEPKEFHLPEANRTMRQLFAYLVKTRGIDSDVVREFVHQRKLFESKDYHNIVFVGKGDDGEAAWAGKKSTNTFGKGYRGNVAGSDKHYSFNHTGGGTSLFVFESPIDMMSYITMYPEGWKEQNYISLDGVATMPLLHFLSQNQHITDVYLCLDNDPFNPEHPDKSFAGQKANARIGKMLTEQGLRVEVLTPELKDWNEDLLNPKLIAQEVSMA